MPTFTNQAVLSFSGVNYASNIVAGEIEDQLEITKSAITDRYTVNGEITYAISLVNNGTTPLNDLTLTDNLGATNHPAQAVVPLDTNLDGIAYYVNGALKPSTNLFITAGPPLTFRGIDVPAGGNAMLIYTAAVNSFAPPAPASSITNTVTVSGVSLQNPITAQETVFVRNTSDLSITKSLFPLTVPGDGQITYTFIIQNSGNTKTDMNDELVLSDNFNPRLSNLTVTYNGNEWEEGVQYTYNQTTGEFVTLPGALSVPAATFLQDPATCEWETDPGTVMLVVSGIL